MPLLAPKLNKDMLMNISYIKIKQNLKLLVYILNIQLLLDKSI